MHVPSISCCSGNLIPASQEFFTFLIQRKRPEILQRVLSCPETGEAMLFQEGIELRLGKP
jgi:hypothetical protein